METKLRLWLRRNLDWGCLRAGEQFESRRDEREGVVSYLLVKPEATCRNAFCRMSVETELARNNFTSLQYD
jgi:hypothetical protein